jgi:hypothetical protein
LADVCTLTGHAEIGALRIHRIVATIVGGEADHEWTQAHAAEAAFADPMIDGADALHAREHVDARERDEPVGMPRRELRDRLVRDPRHSRRSCARRIP